MPDPAGAGRCGDATVLVTGAAGFLGEAVLSAAHAAGWGRVVAATHRSRPYGPHDGEVVLDLAAPPDAVRRLVAAVHPDAVIHTAYVESGPDLDAVTAVGAGAVAEAAASVGARLVHVSTDALHRGDPGSATYADDAVAHPLHAYGRAKADAERRVLAAAPDAVVVRTSLLLADPATGAPGRHERVVLDAVRAAAGGRARASGPRGAAPPVFFTDEVRCPVFVDDVAAALLALALRRDVAGTLNLAGPEACTRAELAVAIARAWGADPAALVTGPTPVVLRRTRPRHVVLDSSRAAALLAPEVVLRGVAALRPHPR